MKRYLAYLKYILKHKWYVTVECFKEGLFWRGIFHDFSKFYPSEFFPYAKFFYNEDGSHKQVRDKTGYYKPTDTGDIDFDFAWLQHQNRNDHHWQWWICPQDDGDKKVLDMSTEAVLEMYCDWKGAGKAQGTPDTIAWYEKNKMKMILNKSSREKIEYLLMTRVGEGNE